MVIKNKLDKTFGPFGTSTGFWLLLGGLIATYFTIYGLIFAITGAFVAFTTTGTIIDSEKKRIKYSDNYFGIIPVGKWIDIKPGMKLGLKRSHLGYVGYIRGTQPVDIHYNDMRIFLYDSDNKRIMPVKKSDSVEASREDLTYLSSLLGLPII